MKPYLFIARKDDSADYCRGCLMASYSSDFEIQNYLSREELVEKWVDYLYKNMNLDINESGYNFYIYENGVQVWKDRCAEWDGQWRFEYDTEEYWDNEYDGAIAQAAMQRISSCYEEAKALAEKRKQDEENQKRAKEEAARVKESVAAQERRRQEFQKLKTEFEGEFK
jgi:hypothetical protein